MNLINVIPNGTWLGGHSIDSLDRFTVYLIWEPCLPLDLSIARYFSFQYSFRSVLIREERDEEEEESLLLD